LVYNNFVNQGKFQVIWDGKDNSGIDVSNGTYIYKIIGETGAVSTGKILVKNNLIQQGHEKSYHHYSLFFNLYVSAHTINYEGNLLRHWNIQKSISL